MAVAYISFSPISNGCTIKAVAVYAEGVRQVGCLYTGTVSLSCSLAREPKIVSVVRPLPFGCNILPSKMWQKNSLFSVAALDLESGYAFGKESDSESERESSLGFNGGSDFGNDSSSSSGLNERRGFGDNQNFRGGLYTYNGQGSITPGKKLYVGNLPWSCDSQQLADVFEGTGAIDVVEVLYDKETGRSRGFGFVTMASIEEAENAVAKLDGYRLEGRSIRVSFQSGGRGGSRFSRGSSSSGGGSSRGEPGISVSKVYVGNLPFGVDDVTLGELFNACGDIVETKVVYDRDMGRSRGYGFVTFSSPTEASQAISRLNGSDCEGRPLRVSLAGENQT